MGRFFARTAVMALFAVPGGSGKSKKMLYKKCDPCYSADYKADIAAGERNRTFRRIAFPAIIRYIVKQRNSRTGFAAGAHQGEAIPIKNEILAVYARSYSEILPFQTAGCAEYILCRTPEGLRMIVRAQHAGEKTARVAQCELGGMPEAAARGLVQFLYENAISVENAGDVVQDAFYTAQAAGKGRPEDAAALP